jgi:hypothetical protein
VTLLPYPPKCFTSEIIGLFFYTILQIIRLRIESMGNKTEIKAYLVYSCLFAVPVLGIYLFYFFFQVYPMIFDFVLCIIGTVFCLLQVLFSLVLSCIIPGYEDEKDI